MYLAIRPETIWFAPTSIAGVLRLLSMVSAENKAVKKRWLPNAPLVTAFEILKD